MTAPIRSMPELIAALRARRDELQITHETIDSIAGWPAGYAGKLLAPEPIKNLGWMSLGLALDTLGIALMVVPDEEQIKRVEKRWTKRERPNRAPASISASIDCEVPIVLAVTSRFKRLIDNPEFLRRFTSLGGKARAKSLSPRQRVVIAKRAARIRWRRQRERERVST